ncbi:MAG: hypothetical protein JXA20_20365 [Spirochaetes bacterium]|nr:hypothetical protein [Spirochaetota bacterium]
MEHAVQAQENTTVTVKSLLRSFALRVELMTTVITVTLVVYVIYLTGGFSPESLVYVVADAALGTLCAVIPTVVFRYRSLSGIVRDFHDPGSDAGKLKARIFSHIFTEGVAGSMRWVVGAVVAIGLMIFQITLDARNVLSICVTLSIIMPISFIILYLTAENVFYDLLASRRLSAARMPEGSCRRIRLISRILMLIGSIAVIPLGILGFLLYLVNSGQMALENLGFHILFISVLSAATVAISMNEMAKNTRRGVDSMVSALGAIRDGRLSIDTVPMLSSNELGMMSLDVNSLLERLRKVISGISDTSSQLSSLSEEISAMSVMFSENAQNQSASSEEISATVEEISAGMESSAGSAREQVQMIETFLSIQEQLSSSVQLMQERVQRMMDLAGEVSSKARLGEDSLARMNGSIGRIGQSSGEMTGIVEIINDISEKINLLSLNAAIEAARAGDYGRGFAVVADEISKLADRTASSIKEIERLIRANEGEIRNGMADVATTVELMSGIIGGVGEIGGMMREVHDSMREQVAISEREGREILKVKERSDEIRGAADAQKDAVGEIMHSITSINELTQSMAQGAEELTAGSRDMAEMAETMKTRVDYFNVE